MTISGPKKVLLALVDCGVAIFNTVGIVPGSFRVCRVCRPLILMCATKFLRRTPRGEAKMGDPTYPLVNGGSDKGSELGVPIFPTNNYSL